MQFDSRKVLRAPIAITKILSALFFVNQKNFLEQKTTNSFVTEICEKKTYTTVFYV